MPLTPPASLPSRKQCRRLREAKPLTLSQAAAELGVDRETVRSWESGRATPRGRERKLYAELLARLAAETGRAYTPASPPRTSPPRTSPASAPPASVSGTAGQDGARRTSGAGAGKAGSSVAGRTGNGAGEGPRTPAGSGAEATARPVSTAGTGSPQVSAVARAGPLDTRPDAPPDRRPASAMTRTKDTTTADPVPRTGSEPQATGPYSAGTHARGVRPTSDDAPHAPRTDSGRPAERRKAGPRSGTANPRKADRRKSAGRGALFRSRDHTSAYDSAGARTTTVQDTASGLTPAGAFDALYTYSAFVLVRQTYLLTGRRALAQESVERAFHLAWQRWPEVAVDADPAGWVRAAAHEYALSPWQRFRPRHRHPDAPPVALDDRTLLSALLNLPPSYRRTLLLHDGIGIAITDVAAETEATTIAAVNRLRYARQAVAARLPELQDPDALHRALGHLADGEWLPAPRVASVRAEAERRTRFWTRAAITFTALILGATALTVRNAPTHYDPPLAPGETIRGVPPRMGPGPLTAPERSLRARLHHLPANTPARLAPQPR